MYSGTQRSEPVGILSIDTLFPIFPRVPIEEELHGGRGSDGKDISKIVDERVESLVNKLSKSLGDSLRQLGDAWAIISQY